MPRRNRGFTLIELMVTLTVLVVVALVALPSFQAQRQRAVLRGAAEQVLSFWNQARMESAKRNTMVKVGVGQQSSGAAFCLGAATTTDTADVTPCDCFTANACNVAQFPNDQAEWNRVTLSAVTLGDSNFPISTAIKPALILPQSTALVASAQDGIVTLAGPPGNRIYRLRLSVDQFGRGVLCEPTAAIDKFSDYTDRRCAP